MKDFENRPSRGRLITMAVIAGLAAVLSCICGLSALFLLRRIDSLPPLISMWQTATPLPALTPAPTPTPQPIQATSTRDRTPTPAAPTVTPTQYAQATSQPSSTPTHTRLPTSTPAPTPTIAASPTPFVCQEIADLSTMTLAPGQRFECTISEETFNTLANSYPESPCSQTRIRLDDGEIQVECRIGLTMSAAVEASAQDCRVALRVLRGTIGFVGIVQELIATQLDTFRYDDVCVDQVHVDDGQAFVAGRGR
jgi:hypothetical protein